MNITRHGVFVFICLSAVLSNTMPAMSAVNQALNKTACASEASAWAAGNAVDGLYATGRPLCGFFELPAKSSWLSGNSPGFPKWWGVDLGDELALTRVVVNSNPAYQPRTMWIETSCDGVKYSKVGSTHVFARCEPGFGFCFPPVKARHVRVCMDGTYGAPGNNQVGLSEVEVYQDEGKSIALEVFEPFNGGMVNSNYDESPGTKDINVYIRGYAHGAKSLEINGQPADIKPDYSFEKLIALAREKEKISVAASNEASLKSVTLNLLVDKYSYKRYWFNVDDVLHMIYDLYLHKDTYQSVFDQPEFAFLKRLHESYGTCSTLMLFGMAGNGEDPPAGVPLNFILSRAPDKFKDEFLANKDWLRFSFHSRDSGSYPYKNATYKQAHNDFIALKKDIDRFAGAECFSPIAVIHYGSGTREAVKAWMEQGLRGYVTGMWLIGKPDLYLAPGTRQYDYMTANDIYVDPENGMAFIQGDMESVERIIDYDKQESAMTMAQYWDAWTAQTGPGMREILTMLAHDHDKWNQSVGLRSDYGKKMNEDSVRWLTSHGYKPTRFYNYEKNEPSLIVKFKPVLAVSRSMLPADGKSETTISINLLDENCMPAAGYEEPIRFETSAGTLVGPNPALVKNGVASISLRAASTPGAANVTVYGEWLWTAETNIVFGR